MSKKPYKQRHAHESFRTMAKAEEIKSKAFPKVAPKTNFSQLNKAYSELQYAFSQLNKTKRSIVLANAKRDTPQGQALSNESCQDILSLELGMRTLNHRLKTMLDKEVASHEKDDFTAL